MTSISTDIILCAICAQLAIATIWLAVISGRIADLVRAIRNLKGRVE